MPTKKPRKKKLKLKTDPLAKVGGGAGGHHHHHHHGGSSGPSGSAPFPSGHGPAVSTSSGPHGPVFISGHGPAVSTSGGSGPVSGASGGSLSGPAIG